MRKCFYLTLLEMMLVIAILAVFGGVLALKIDRVIREQRFTSEAHQVVDQLRLAQNLMLIFHTNVHVHIMENTELRVLDCWLTFDTPLPGHWGQDLQRVHHFKMIKEINFWDPNETTVTKSEDPTIPPQIIPDRFNELTIAFLSGGSKMSKNILLLATAKKEQDPGALESWVCLQGYPAPITLLSKNPEDNCLIKEQPSDAQLTQQTFEEIYDAS